MSKIAVLFPVGFKAPDELREYADSGMDYSVFRKQISRREKVRDIKRKWNWVKNNSEIADSN